MLPARTSFNSERLQEVFQNFIQLGGSLPLKEALRNHDNSLINDFLSLIDFDDIEENQRELENAQNRIFESVLKAKSDPTHSGTISCLITVGNSQFVVTEIGNKLVIFDGSFQGQKITAGKIINGKTFKDLKRVALIQYLYQKRQLNPRVVVDASQFNLKGVDLDGICLLNLVWGEEAANVLGGSKIDPRGMNVDKNVLFALIAAGISVKGIVLIEKN